MFETNEGAEAGALTAAQQLTLKNFDALPDSAHVEVAVVAAWRGTSVPSVWRHARTGVLPKPVKLGPNTTRWNVGALRRATNTAAA